MSTDKQTFEDWLDGKTVDSPTEQSWHDNDELKDHYETGLWLKHQAQCYSEESVPQWDAESTFAFKKEQKDWFGWLRVTPQLSMAMSVAAILMVLFRVELQFNDDGVLLSFAGNSSQKMDALMDEKIKRFGRDQQIVLASYMDDIQAQQQQDVTQLASYLVNASRTERKEEMGALVSYLKDQRDEDMSLNQHKMRNIIYSLNGRTTGATMQKAAYDPAAGKSYQSLLNKESGFTPNITPNLMKKTSNKEEK